MWSTSILDNRANRTVLDPDQIRPRTRVPLFGPGLPSVRPGGWQRYQTIWRRSHVRRALVGGRGGAVPDTTRPGAVISEFGAIRCACSFQSWCSLRGSWLAFATSRAHLIQMFDSTIVRCSRVGGRSKGGARRPGARALARRLHHEDPCNGCLRGHHRLRPDRRRSLRRASLRNPARYRARHSSAPRRHLRQRLRQQGQAARRQERAASLPSSPTRPTKRPSQPSSHAPSTRP